MKSTRNHLSQDDFNMVLDYIPKLNLRKYKIEDIQMLFKISYWCGLRIGEALKLTVQSFDFERNASFYNQTGAITSLTIYFTSNFSGGTYILYGVK